MKGTESTERIVGGDVDDDDDDDEDEDEIDKYEYENHDSFGKRVNGRSASRKLPSSRSGRTVSSRSGGLLSARSGRLLSSRSAKLSSQQNSSKWDQMTASVTRSSRSISSRSGGQPVPAVSDRASDEEEDSSDCDEFEVGLEIERTFGMLGMESGTSQDKDDHRSTSSSSSSADDDSTEGQDLDRATVRLDGIEVYAIVSALTCATSISCFDNFNPTPIDRLIRERDVVTFLAELLYYASGSLGMMTGLHATLIFSLVTMYGRTALGIDRDDAFNQFFSNTGAARFNGFISFQLSLYCFMTQLTFLIGQKFVFEPLRPFVLMFTGFYAYKTMYMDSQSVVKAAGVIFTPAPVVPVDRRESMKSTVRRGSSVVRRSSVKRGNNALSTRAFGIDTRKSYASS